ncbi:hypothetical protein [Mucilaginibacter lacusdianchii]|uniref:hypothetical protein n=1 Tax=Mucilaginibacter lacusdianchii TaxID=2684211 RepID=UPI00131B4079|nr:hypothetical protein [Mucilaginibacter sp. JXJ CY 39]
MQKISNDKQKSPARRFLFILGAALFISVFILGLLIMFWKKLPIALTQYQRFTFGGLFILYGILRFVRIVRTRIYEE